MAFDPNFGMKAALIAALDAHEREARGSGRTTSTILEARPGDTIVVGVGEREAQRLRPGLQRNGVHVVYSGPDPEGCARAAGEHRGRSGRLIYDHTAVLVIWRQEIERIAGRFA